MAMEDPEEEFQFDGWLRFNGLYFTELLDDVDPGSLISSNDFPEYEQGSPHDSSEGYLQTDLADRLGLAGDLTGGLANLAENLYTYRFVSENWVPMPSAVDEDGVSLDQPYHPAHKEIDMFWHFDDLLVFRGRKSTIEEKRRELRGGLSGKVRIEKVSFDFDFLLWLLYNCHEGDELRSSLRLHSISDCTTIGETQMGEIAVGEASEVVRSAPFIIAILEQNRIDNLEGDFIMGSHYIVAEIDSEGWVHVKASREDMEQLSDLRQMGIAVNFVTELLALYEEWLLLDRTDQYPPPEFFHTLIELCEDEGYVPTREPDELLAEYEQKRNGELPGPSANYGLAKFN